MSCPRCVATATTELPQRTALGYRAFNERTGIPFNPVQVPTDVVLLVVLWRLRYKLSLRELVEMSLAVLAECAVSPNQRSPVQRGGVRRNVASGSPTRPCGERVLLGSAVMLRARNHPRQR